MYLLWENDTCMGQGNTNVSHFVVPHRRPISLWPERAFHAARAALLPMRRASDHFGCAENCLLLYNKSWLPPLPAVVSLFWLTPLPVLTTQHHFIIFTQLIKYYCVCHSNKRSFSSVLSVDTVKPVHSFTYVLNGLTKVLFWWTCT